jgi:hypothetical protein
MQEGSIVKSAQTSILAVCSQQAATSRTEAARYGITRALESMGRALVCLVSARALSAPFCVALFAYSPVTGCAPAACDWYDAQIMNLRFAQDGRGMIHSCVAACHNYKANVWGNGTTGGQGVNPSVSGTDAGT